MQICQVGSLRLVSTPIEAGAHLVRFMAGDGPLYDRMTVATLVNDGRAVHLAGWIGKPLTPAEWLAARGELFPTANEVLFERLRADGLFSHRRLQLPK